MADLSDAPAGAISRLNDALARRGQPVTLRRYLDPEDALRPKSDLPLRAFVRPGKPPETLVGNIDQDYWDVVISPTDFASMWPIVKGDKILIEGSECNVELPKPIRMQGVLVRCNLLVAG
jgi:hypothetical protein